MQADCIVQEEQWGKPVYRLEEAIYELLGCQTPSLYPSPLSQVAPPTQPTLDL